jgi:hypothetical protein
LQGFPSVSGRALVSAFSRILRSFAA